MGRDRAWVMTQSNSASALGRPRLPTLRQGWRPDVPAAVGLASLSTSDGCCPLHEWKGRRLARRIEGVSATALPFLQQRVGAGLRVLLERNAHEQVDERQYQRIGPPRCKTAS